MPFSTKSGFATLISYWLTRWMIFSDLLACLVCGLSTIIGTDAFCFSVPIFSLRTKKEHAKLDRWKKPLQQSRQQSLSWLTTCFRSLYNQWPSKLICSPASMPACLKPYLQQQQSMLLWMRMQSCCGWFVLWLVVMVGRWRLWWEGKSGRLLA